MNENGLTETTKLDTGQLLRLLRVGILNGKLMETVCIIDAAIKQWDRSQAQEADAGSPPDPRQLELPFEP